MAAVQSLKDKELQAYYEALFALYGTPGWQKLMEDLVYMERTHNALEGVETEAQLHFRKGQVDQIRWLKNHQEATEFAYNQILAEQDGGDVGEEKPAGGRATVIG